MKMKISIYLTILSLCVIQVLSKKQAEPTGIVGIVSAVIDFIFGNIVPMFKGSNTFNTMCDNAFDLVPFTEPCDCDVTPTLMPPSASASLTCPMFDSCPDNMGFACGGCDVVVGVKGAFSGPALDGKLGAKCSVKSPIFDFVSIETSGALLGGTSGIGLDSCEVTASALGVEVAICDCSTDTDCGTFGITYSCSVGGINLFSSGGCVALDSFSN